MKILFFIDSLRAGGKERRFVELIKRISSPDPEYQMPTPESHLGVLTEREIKLFTAWIKQGAKYEPHWAFTKPVKSSLPEIKEKQWVKNEIDYFTLAAMEEHDLSPNNEAGKAFLLKRVSLDLTGLLPTINMMEAFEADKSAAAYEKMVDRLFPRRAQQQVLKKSLSRCGRQPLGNPVNR